MIQVQLKLRPTKAQVRTLERWLWHLTAVWNWTVKKVEAEPRLTRFDLNILAKGHARRLGISAYALGGTICTAHLAWQRTFSGIAGRPKLKGRRRPLSSIAFDHWGESSPRGRRIAVPIIGPVRFHAQDVPVGADVSGINHNAHANAEFIVRACNSHDDLLAALKAYRGGACGCVLGNDFIKCGLCVQADAAILKAEGR